MCERTEAMREVREAAACLAYVCMDNAHTIAPMVAYYHRVATEPLPEAIKKLLDSLD